MMSSCPAADLSAVIPDPSSKPLGLLGRLCVARDNQLWIYNERDFTNSFSRSRYGFQRFVLLNHPSYTKHILVTNPGNYEKSRLTKKVLVRLMGKGLLTSEGSEWLMQRKEVAPAFQQKHLAAATNIITDYTQAMADRWRPAAELGEPIDISEEMQFLAMQIVGKVFLSVDFEDFAHDMTKAVNEFLEILGRPNISDVLGLPEWFPRRLSSEVLSSIELVDHVIYGVLKKRRSKRSENFDVLSILMQSLAGDNHGRATDRQIRDQITTLCVAGYETTATALTWTWFLIAQHPHVEARLHEELDTVLCGRSATFEDLADLPYTGMVFEETLRLFPPVHTFNRVALADDEIDGRKIRAGTIVVISPYLIHRNPKLWENPHRFDPDRFAPDLRSARNQYSYIPFGAGPRICIGRSLAIIEARLILATLAQTYCLKLVPGHPVEAQARITLRPRHGISFLVEKRV